MADGDVGVRPELGGDRGGAELVGGVGVGVEEVDDEGLAALGEEVGDGGAGGGLVEGGEDAAPGVGALGDLEAEVAGDDGGEAAGHAVGVGPGAAAELEDVAEALGGDEAGAGEAALEDGVGGGGGAVDDEVDGGEVDAGRRRGRRGRRWPGSRAWSGSWRGGRCRRRGRRGRGR